MYNTSELDELFRILNLIKGFKLKQPQWSNTTVQVCQICYYIAIKYINQVRIIGMNSNILTNPKVALTAFFHMVKVTLDQKLVQKE